MFYLKDQTALILADAGPQVGTRSVRRCLLIAEALKSQGIQSNFLARTLPAKLQRRITGLGFGVYQPDSTTSVEICESTNFLVQDQANASTGLDLSLSTQLTRLVMGAWDRDVPPKNLTLDLGCEFSDSVLGNCLQGPEYFLPVETQQSGPIRKRVRKIVVVAQDQNTLDRVLAAIVFARCKGLAIDVVASEFVDSQYHIESEFSQLECQLRIHRNFDRLGLLLELGDLAIVDRWENYWSTVALGLPSIFCTETGSIAPLHRELASQGCMLLADLLDVESFGSLIRLAIQKQEIRSRLFCNSRGLVDGQGASRVARSMVASQFHIRPCRIEDSEVLYGWRNDPELRVVCFQQERIPYESHESWLRERLASDQTEIYIFEDSTGKPVGQFRLEFSDSWERVRLHLSVVPSLRGHGLGTAFIERAFRLAVARYPDIEVCAFVRPVNQASQVAFRKAGFVSDATITINGQVALRMRKYSVLRNATEAVSYKEVA